MSPGSVDATRAPIAAIPIKPATRAIALLIAEAIPASLSSASASTVAVSGATVAANPSAKRRSAGRRSKTYDGLQPDPQEEQDACCGDQRSRGQEEAWPVPVCECAEASRQREHGHGHGDRRQAGLKGRVARDLLQEDEEEEEEHRQACVDRERLQVGDREVPTLEQVEPQHRVGRALLVDDERPKRDDTAEKRNDDHRAPPPESGLLNEPEDDSGQPEGAQGGADKVDSTLHRWRIRNSGPGEHQRDEDERDVDREDPAPGRLVHKQAAHKWSDNDCDSAPRGPRSNRGTTFALRERCGDERQRARRQKCPCNPLQRPSCNQGLDRRRHSTRQ